MRVIAQSNGLKLLRRLSGKLGLTETPAESALGMAAAAGGGSGFPFNELEQAMKSGAVSTAPLPQPLPPAHPELTANHDALAKLLHVMEAPAPSGPLVREICDDLRGLLDILETPGEPAAERPGPVVVPRDPAIREFPNKRPEEVHPVLAGKTVGLAGFSQGQYLHCSSLFQRQQSRCLDAGSPFDIQPQIGDQCDLLILASPAAWELLNPLRPAVLLQTSRPVLVTGPPRLLTRVAQLTQPGAREYVADPWRDEEIVWRSAMLLERQQRSGNPAGESMKRENPEILIADEDVTTRTLLASMLQRHGMTVHLAENGVEALELLHTRKPCAAILDIVMPGLDGFQVLAAAKQDPVLSGTPMMLLTTRCGEVDKLQAFALGADDYLTKPFSPMELAVRLKRLLKRAG
ncbi:MAG: response regulator [Bryobacterales bacterium]|nr:response regulator [Bryobacterales bacterium]